ncbi:MAG: hypothetical protein JJ992_14745, partial [Planctomycetes bacterium]|nr:hypothetical protein [Planctomycetota bacterium]
VFGVSDENISTRTFNFVEVYDPANDTWSSKSNMPNNRGAMGTCAMNGQIYAVGGVTDRLVVITLNQIYDPVTDAWTTKAPLQEKRIYYFGSLKEFMGEDVAFWFHGFAWSCGCSYPPAPACGGQGHAIRFAWCHAPAEPYARCWFVSPV